MGPKDRAPTRSFTLTLTIPRQGTNMRAGISVSRLQVDDQMLHSASPVALVGETASSSAPLVTIASDGTPEGWGLVNQVPPHLALMLEQDFRYPRIVFIRYAACRVSLWPYFESRLSSEVLSESEPDP